MTECYRTRCNMPPLSFSLPHPATIGRGRVVNDRFLQHKSGSSTFTYSGLHPEALLWLTLFRTLKG